MGNFVLARAKCVGAGAVSYAQLVPPTQGLVLGSLACKAVFGAQM